MKKALILLMLLAMGSTAFAANNVDLDSQEGKQQAYLILNLDSAKKSTARLISSYTRLASQTKDQNLKDKIQKALPALKEVQAAF